ncbi:hypothetical protein O181_084547 [Austropuccinia psidii MF-1]|uniref:Uncharacterized protein n=1 Tax=Austropuccinia psidii MF-1 TaxID=1389203 RepID=A0A9Q3FWG9_9BASI|nr:hypothetical protein [Austropuccinia psidii MF-1]
MPPCACPVSQHFTCKYLHLSRIPTLHMQIPTPVQDPNASHAKPCTVNPYTGAASQQCQQCLMLVQAPNASHANPYVVQVPDNSNSSLRLCRLPTIKTQILTLVQFPTLHMHILMPVQVHNNSDNFLRLGSLLKILKIHYTTKINSV